MAKQAKVAIIEDDEIILDIYTLIVKDGGFKVKTARDGKSGLEMIEKFKPDLVLLDLMMPLMNGAEMLKELRSKPWGKDIKVLIMTNIGRSEAPGELASLNVADIVTKVDISPDQLIRLINKHLETSS